MKFRFFLESDLQGPDAVGFIKNILKNIYDDSAWLVFADWLEDRGNPTGDVIRSILDRRSNPKGRMKDLNQKIKQLKPLLQMPVGGFNPTYVSFNPSAKEPPFAEIQGPTLPGIFPNITWKSSCRYTYYPEAEQSRIKRTGYEHWIELNIPADTLVASHSIQDMFTQQPLEGSEKWDFPYYGNKVEPQVPEIFVATFYGILKQWIPSHLKQRRRYF